MRQRERESNFEKYTSFICRLTDASLLCISWSQRKLIKKQTYRDIVWGWPKIYESRNYRQSPKSNTGDHGLAVGQNLMMSEDLIFGFDSNGGRLINLWSCSFLFLVENAQKSKHAVLSSSRARTQCKGRCVCLVGASSGSMGCIYGEKIDFITVFAFFYIFMWVHCVDNQI